MNEREFIRLHHVRSGALASLLVAPSQSNYFAHAVASVMYTCLEGVIR